MKKKINKAAWEALSKDVQVLYKADGDNYLLQLEDDPADELRRGLERERGENERLRTQVTTLTTEVSSMKTKLDTIDSTTLRQAGDINQIEKSWKDKVTTLEGTHKTDLEKKNEQLRKLLVTSVAEKIASEISTAPSVILPHILPRLTADFDAAEPTTRVLGKDGKISAITLDELKKEFVDNPDFGAILIGTNGSGAAGGTGKRNGSGAASSGKKFAEMSEAERTAFFKSDPEGFKRERDATLAAARRM